MRRRRLLVFLGVLTALVPLGAGCVADNPDLEPPAPINEDDQPGRLIPDQQGAPASPGLVGGEAAQAPPRLAGAVDLDGAYGQMGAAYHHMFQLGDLLAGAIAGQRSLGDVKGAGSDLRVNLGRLFGEHAVLVGTAMRKRASGASDDAAASRLLDANATALGGAVRAVARDEVRQAFVEQWRSHVRLLLEVARAARLGDAALRERSVEELTQFQTTFARFLTEATAADPAAMAALVAEHVKQVLDAFDAAQGGDQEAAELGDRVTYAHMFAIADAIAEPISRQSGQGRALTPASDVRVAADRLLGEHAALAALTMQRDYDGDPALGPSQEALDTNGSDLAALLGSAFGDETAAGFLERWRAHVDLLGDYTAATRAKDEGARQAARSALEAYTSSFPQFLSVAVRVPHATLAQFFREHLGHLTTFIDAYAGA